MPLRFQLWRCPLDPTLPAARIGRSVGEVERRRNLVCLNVKASLVCQRFNEIVRVDVGHGALRSWPLDVQDVGTSWRSSLGGFTPRTAPRARVAPTVFLSSDKEPLHNASETIAVPKLSTIPASRGALMVANKGFPPFVPIFLTKAESEVSEPEETNDELDSVETLF